MLGDLLGAEQYVPKTYENDETRRQVLARSKHLLLMHSSKWTEVQQKRADVLFRLAKIFA